MQKRTLSPDVSPVLFPSFTEAYLALKPSETEQADFILDLTDQEGPICDFHNMMEDSKDYFTRDHSRRVAKAAVVIGMRLGLSDYELFLLAEGAESHDVGKLLDPAIQAIVKSDVCFELGSSERNVAMAEMERHPFMSVDLIAQSSWSHDRKRQVGSIAGAHHLYSSRESYGLQPDSDVAHLAEIVAVADMLDAFASKRPYKLPYARDVILDLLQTQFIGDQDIVAVVMPQPRSASQMLASAAISH